MIRREDPSPPELEISDAQIAFIVLRARAYDVQVEAVIPDDASDEPDDRAIGVLNAGRDNSSGEELRGAINALSDDGKAELVALTWVGRGDFDNWVEAKAMARERASGGPAWRYLMGVPMLGDLLEEGADKLGISLTVEETEGLHHPSVERMNAGEEPL
jgi:Protein of unknown function (DUF3775)